MVKGKITAMSAKCRGETIVAFYVMLVKEGARFTNFCRVFLFHIRSPLYKFIFTEIRKLRISVNSILRALRIVKCFYVIYDKIYLSKGHKR